jgi:ABC-type Fe3+ transport system permease subunit
MTDGLGPAIIAWGALGAACMVAILVKNRVRTRWRTYKFSWREALPAWWSIFWRTVLYGVIGGHFAGYAARVIAMEIGHPDYTGICGSVATVIAVIVFSVAAVKEALQLHVGRLTDAVASTSLAA